MEKKKKLNNTQRGLLIVFLLDLKLDSQFSNAFLSYLYIVKI